MTPSTTSVAAIVEGIDARLAELQPLVDEHNQLQAARAVLTENGAASAPAGSRRRVRPSPSPRAARRTASGRAPRGANRAAILVFVAKNPGATVAQISEATGIAKPTLHTTVYGLKRRGELVPSGEGVALSSAPKSRARPRVRRPRRIARRAARRSPSRRRARKPPRPGVSQRSDEARSRPAADPEA